MQITLNGEQRSVSQGTTVAGLVAALKLGGRRVAVEVNGGVVPRGTQAATALADGDRVEIVHAIGGG
ncbi:MAG: sulfur carrier protein ThiS [Gammaproteobacteria bacterium]